MAHVDFEGEVYYFKGNPKKIDMGENLSETAREKIELEQGHYNALVKITPETKQYLLDKGIPNTGMQAQLFKEKDGEIYYKIKRPHFNPRVNQGEGKVMGPPIVQDADGNDWDDDVEIGHGSHVKVRVDNWQNKIVTWTMMRVIDLVEYEADPTAGF